MDVDDPSERCPFLVPVEKLSREDRDVSNADVRLRVGQEICDQLQNFGIALRSIIESRGIDESYRPSIESELLRDPDLGGTRLKGHSDL